MFLPLIPRVQATGWVVRFDDIREVFEGFDRAKGYLLSELQALAFDHETEEAWAAWDAVRKWQNTNEEKIYSVEVGNPPGTYYLVRLDKERKAFS